METTTPTRVQQLGGHSSSHMFACRCSLKGFSFSWILYTAWWLGLPKNWKKPHFFKYLKILCFLSQKIKGQNFMETPRMQTLVIHMIHLLSQHTLLIIQTLSLFISFHLTFQRFSCRIFITQLPKWSYKAEYHFPCTLMWDQIYRIYMKTMLHPAKPRPSDSITKILESLDERLVTGRDCKH